MMNLYNEIEKIKEEELKRKAEFKAQELLLALENILNNLPELWGDYVVDGKIKVLLDNDSVENAFQLIRDIKEQQNDNHEGEGNMSPEEEKALLNCLMNLQTH